MSLESGTEFGASAILEYRGLDPLFLRLEAQLGQQTYDFVQNESEVSGQWRFTLLEVPVLLRTPIYNGIDLGGGPGVAFLLSAEEEVSDVTDLGEQFKTAFFKGYAFVGYSRVFDPWFTRVELRYVRSLTAMAKDVTGDVSVHNQSVLLNFEVRR